MNLLNVAGVNPAVYLVALSRRQNHWSRWGQFQEIVVKFALGCHLGASFLLVDDLESLLFRVDLNRHPARSRLRIALAGVDLIAGVFTTDREVGGAAQCRRPGEGLRSRVRRVVGDVQDLPRHLDLVVIVKSKGVGRLVAIRAKIAVFHAVERLLNRQGNAQRIALGELGSVEDDLVELEISIGQAGYGQFPSLGEAVACRNVESW